MSTLTPDQEVEAQVLRDAIAAACADDLLAIARLLVGKPSHQVFGQTELQLRDLVHRLGAKALDLYLEEKKTATSAPP
jgi:hypothetical protein